MIRRRHELLYSKNFHIFDHMKMDERKKTKRIVVETNILLFKLFVKLIKILPEYSEITQYMNLQKRVFFFLNHDFF